MREAGVAEAGVKPGPPPLPLEPGGRRDVWDALRGMGVLGIFILHVFWFGMPQERMLTQGFDFEGGWAMSLAGAIGNGKFISVLAMVFGAGSAMLAARWAARGEPARPRLVRRALAMGAIGVAHYVLLFMGDILQAYALALLAATLFVNASDKTLKLLALIGWAVSLTLGTLLMGALALMIVFKPGATDGMADGSELAAFSQGTFLDQVVFRLWGYLEAVFITAMELPAIIGMVALGMLAYRRRWLTDPAHLPLLRKVAVWGLAVGVPLNLASALAISPAAAWAAIYPQRYLGGPLLGFGLAATVALLIHAGAFRPLTHTLAVVGKRSLSVYLGQSLLASVLFYSWGLGLYDRLPAPTLLFVVVPGIWAVVIAAAYALNALNLRGPAEWAWRKMAPT